MFLHLPANDSLPKHIECAKGSPADPLLVPPMSLFCHNILRAVTVICFMECSDVGEESQRFATAKWWVILERATAGHSSQDSHGPNRPSPPSHHCSQLNSFCSAQTVPSRLLAMQTAQRLGRERERERERESGDQQETKCTCSCYLMLQEGKGTQQGFWMVADVAVAMMVRQRAVVPHHPADTGWCTGTKCWSIPKFDRCVWQSNSRTRRDLFIPLRVVQ